MACSTASSNDPRGLFNKKFLLSSNIISSDRNAVEPSPDIGEISEKVASIITQVVLCALVSVVVVVDGLVVAPTVVELRFERVVVMFKHAWKSTALRCGNAVLLIDVFIMQVIGC